MFRSKESVSTRIASALLIAQVLAFAIGVVPEHISAHPSHSDCDICALIHHPPALQAHAIVPKPLLPEVLFTDGKDHHVIAEPQAAPRPSRAPPCPSDTDL